MPERPNFRLRTAEQADVRILSVIVMAATQGQLSPHGGWDEQTARFRLAADLAEERARRSNSTDDPPHRTTSVIEVDGSPVGRLLVMRERSRVELCGIQLHPDKQGLGIGTAIISDLKTEAAAAGIPLDVSVRKSNYSARRLYERLGCHKIDESEQEVRLRCTP